MATVPTGEMERELRKLYLRWLVGVPRHQDDIVDYIEVFRVQSQRLIERLGGQAASLGALADFPVPKMLELDPVAGVVYDQMKQAAIQAGIAAGLQSTDVARQILNAGLGKGFRRLERLARTETTNAYWRNTWASVADLPAIVLVWGAEESKRTCEFCLSRDGLVVEDPTIRDHPNGRCTLVPTLRSRVQYKGTLQADGSIVMDERWTGRASKTVGVAGPTTPEQRDPLSGKRNPAAPSTTTDIGAPATQDYSRMTNADKLAAVRTMYGVNSPQYKQALARWGGT
ncbi:minor capsid protein [Microbacterium phage HerculesXL]|nr:minor capsid protein [Microbacterium phage HerculesXL]